MSERRSARAHGGGHTPQLRGGGVEASAEAGTVAGGEADPTQAITGETRTSIGTHKKRTSNWTDTDLEQAMNSITNDALSLR